MQNQTNLVPYAEMGDWRGRKASAAENPCHPRMGCGFSSSYDFQNGMIILSEEESREDAAQPFQR
ncbi:hypothetical protein ACOBR2_13160 [Telmatobacter bradus]|uniref:hypothetical protein n=1 Tax=Telmatobacter bradus TaxID=474953 RepID=UPI003B439870